MSSRRLPYFALVCFILWGVCDALSQPKRDFSPSSTLQANNTFITENDTVTLAVHAGWNLISLPVEVADARKSVLFPTAISDAYTYDNGYVQRDTLEPGVGYWLKFSEADTVTLVGSLFEVDSVEVNTRWNLIGAPGFSLSTSKITTVPESLIVTDYFEFDPQGGYSAATTLVPGKGYWVKTDTVGKLFFTPWEYLGLEGQDFTAVAAEDSNTIYVATRSTFMERQGAIFKTTTAGQTWDTLLSNLSVLDLKLHPANPNILYAALGGVVDPPYGILKTTDGGANWFFAYSGIYVDWENDVQKIYFDPQYPETLYATTADIGVFDKLYKTSNGGQSWNLMSDSIIGSVGSIAIHPETTSTIWAAGSYIYKTTDGGQSWLRLTGSGQPSMGFYSIAVVPTDVRILFAGVLPVDGKFLKSTDGGYNWYISNNGLPDGTGGHNPKFNLLNSRVYCRTGSGVYESRDSGENWSRLEGLPTVIVRSYSFSFDFKYLYSGVNYYGLYRKRILK